MKKRRWIWALATGVVGCLGLFMALTFGQKQPSVADQIPMLRELRPAQDKTILRQKLLFKEDKIRRQLFIFHENHKDVAARLRQQIRRKPLRMDGPSDDGVLYRFGAETKIDPQTTLLFRDQEKETCITIFADGENETSVGIEENLDITWADRVSFWWAGMTGRRLETKPWRIRGL